MENNYSDYWLDDFDFDDEVNDNAINTNLIKLAMARRAISNFVHILTNKPIPVYFNDGGDNSTCGEVVHISSDIINKEDFDPAVGLALHEGSHVLLSDFNIFKTIWQKVPRELYNYGQRLQISKEDIHILVKNMLNYIEDRYIDNYVFKSAPGYRGYYNALYDTYFNSVKIDAMLKSDLYRVPSIASYEARIINFNNKNTDLDALPGLRDIAKLINLSEIDRLKTTYDRLQVAYDVCAVILQNIVEAPQKATKVSSTSDNNGSETDSQEGTDSNTEENSQDAKIGTTTSASSGQNVDDVLGGEETTKVSTTDEKTVKDNIGEDPKVSKTKTNQIKKSLEKQKDFLNGSIKKKKVSSKEKKILDAIEKSGMTLVSVGNHYVKSDGKYKVDCIVVKKMTKELIDSELFPLSMIDHKGNSYASKEMINAVNEGFIKGAVLGRRLQIRNEVNTCKHMRKSTGRIDKRILSELSYDNENVFYNIDVDRYNKSYIHISVDASSSMGGSKWLTTMTAVTAICKAASMIDNVRVSVSFRTTFQTTGRSAELPYVVIAYDSATDKISKVKNLFSYINPAGCTPEGLCYESIMNELPTSADDNYYFLNFSDGQPFMNYQDITGGPIQYAGEQACIHTRTQVNKVRDKGYKILSYFIKEEYESLYSSFSTSSISTELNNVKKQFKVMYGQNASFVNVKNIFDIAKSINKMFLNKD